MATLTIRNLPDETQRALKARAARNDRSMEAEVRDILQNAVASEQDFITGWLASAESLRGEFTLPDRSAARHVDLA
ncbi:FitA-like ribbon-helix-helix domain-containing protein [Gordonia sp. (in: high G+C Gram-positive bacteria)]|jgi:plasmid stability protein|uniref:FitA-like ribbon-helix-helix domain-containing protein n=1 Tax=Gordonia sp. (in: high G+C Gram-positive bacteria) TaxID=84139 RepID=UPI001E0F8A37|nr:antitoxin [Gordonia sp. (in: high G+C Gram-positive bacteria)]MCB1294858.1 antitoxin [Gordonia sp. (in: high G+C Gram-positive bacteria)]HMS74522.1 antitoxin [Gordonia sp. (in: high G+C Gram-positive bacteria)]HQV16731.1 antitoxin [Gordonia sp. (in: high G+C Gram-positive bacteria)]